MVSSESPITFAASGTNALWDLVESLAQTRFASGVEPFAQSLKLRGVARAADLVPIGSARWHVSDVDSERVLARGPAWTALVERWRNGSVDVSVTAADADVLAKAVAEIRARSPVLVPSPDRVDVEFWYTEGDCPKHVSRPVEVPAWDDIRAHYPATVRDQLDVLTGMGPPAGGGRLLLWHGPPGTGKTTAIRALLRAWSGWCRPLFVVDAERFLGRAGYLVSVVLGREDHDDEDDEQDAEGRPRWRLLVFEDADELLRADAKRESGQALSRLLSLSDGFIGQGVNVLVLITTNEPIGRLHPAVARPGRCLANTEFRALTPREAAALLGGPAWPERRGGPAAEVTLAEVFERRGDIRRLAATGDGDPPTGQYL